MSDLAQQVRSVVTESKTRLDFADAIEQAGDLIAQIHRDGTLLEMQKRGALAAVNAAIDVLKQRYDSPLQLNEALRSIEDEADIIPEPASGLLAQWFFHIAYSGHEVGSETVEIARRIIARRQPNPRDNQRELARDLDRYEWLANFGPNPALSRNNAKGVLVATTVRPLPGGALETLASRAFNVLEIADRRCAKPIIEQVQESLAHCRKLIAEAMQQHGQDQSFFMAQAPSFGVRVSLTTIEDLAQSNPALVDAREDLTEDVSELRGQLDLVGYRSSSVVFAGYQRKFDAFRETLLQSIDFPALSVRLQKLQSQVNDARNGRAGLDQLAMYHWQQAKTIVTGLSRSLDTKRRSGDELKQRIDAARDLVEQLERAEALSTGPIKKLEADIRRSSSLGTWADEFDNKAGRDAIKSLIDLRTRLATLRERSAREEPTRAAQFAQSCANLTKAIGQAAELPSLLPEVLELRRSLDEFSPSAQRPLRAHVDGTFAAFRERARNTQLLADFLSAIRAEIDGHRRRILRNIDFEDLLRRAAVGKRWAALRDFPEQARPASARAAKACLTEIYKLQARQQRVMVERAARAADVFSELEADVATGVSEATASPGRQDCWDELVSLNRRIRESGAFLNEPQRAQLQATLDGGFQKVRAARAAFAVEAGQRFAYYNDVIGDILASLEESPNRDTAFSAIDRLKPLRADLRDEKKLLRAQRAEIVGGLNAASQAVEEIFEHASKESKAVAVRLIGELDRLARLVSDASDWNSTFALIASHKQQSAAVRDSQLSINDRRDLRLRLESMWEDIAEKLQQYRFGRAIESLDATIRRLEQHGWLLMVNTVPRIA